MESVNMKRLNTSRNKYRRNMALAEGCFKHDAKMHKSGVKKNDTFIFIIIKNFYLSNDTIMKVKEKRGENIFSI